MAWSSAQAAAVQHVLSGVNAKALASSVGAGNLLVCHIALDTVSATITSVTDNRSNTWTPVGSLQSQTGNGNGQIYYTKNVAAGSTTVSVTPSAGASHIIIEEYAGLDTVNPLEANIAAQGTVSANADSGSATPTANSLVVGFIYAIRAITAGSGFTERANDSYFNFVQAEDRLAPGGSVNVTGTLSDATGSWVALLAAFRLPTGASTGSSGLALMGVG